VLYWGTTNRARSDASGFGSENRYACSQGACSSGNRRSPARIRLVVFLLTAIEASGYVGFSASPEDPKKPTGRAGGLSGRVEQVQLPSGASPASFAAFARRDDRVLATSAGIRLQISRSRSGNKDARWCEKSCDRLDTRTANRPSITLSKHVGRKLEGADSDGNHTSPPGIARKISYYGCTPIPRRTRFSTSARGKATGVLPICTAPTIQNWRRA